jgi:hypothetical protein
VSGVMGVLQFVLAVLGAWDKLRALAVWLVKTSAGLVRWVVGVIRCPDPLSIQLAEAVDGLGYSLGFRLCPDPDRRPRLFVVSTVPLTTWLQRPAAGLDSYRRHIGIWREFQAAGLR